MAKTAIALGTFDGVHIGHLSVINAAVLSGYNSVAVAFPVPPRCTLSGNTELLTTPFEKNEILRAARVDRVHFLDFESIQNIEPEDFLLFLKSTFNPALISCGFNYRFGKGGKGDCELLGRLCEENGIELCVIPPVQIDGATVSSTEIRGALAKGDTLRAALYLGRPYSITASIVGGQQLGVVQRDLLHRAVHGTQQLLACDKVLAHQLAELGGNEDGKRNGDHCHQRHRGA